MKKIFVLLIVSSMLAGCTDAIPAPEEWFGECETVESMTESGSVVVLTNETGNTISFGNTSKWMEVVSVTYTATHLSFIVDNNSVIFNNITFVDMQGDLYQYNNDSISQTIQVYTYELSNNTTLVETEHNVSITYDVVDKIYFRNGDAPNIGLVWFELPKFDYDITIDYQIEYKLTTGKECKNE